MSLKKLVQLHKLLALEPWKALQPATYFMNYTPKLPSRGCFFFSVFLHLVKFPVKVFTFGTKHQPVVITQAGTHQVSEQIWGGLHYPVRVNVANYFLFFHSQLHCSLQKQTVSCAACSLIVKRVLSRTIHVTLYFCTHLHYPVYCMLLDVFTAHSEFKSCPCTVYVRLCICISHSHSFMCGICCNCR